MEKEFIFHGGDKNGKGKGGKYLKKGNIFCRGEGKREKRRKSKKIFGEGKYLFVEEKKNQRRQRRKMFGEVNIFVEEIKNGEGSLSKSLTN